MKKSLQQLIDDGWEADPEDLERVNRQKAREQSSKNAASLESAVSRVARATESTHMVNVETSKKLDTLIQAQGEFMRQMKADMALQQPSDWEFEVTRRNKSGFISKVYAKRIQ